MKTQIVTFKQEKLIKGFKQREKTVSEAKHRQTHLDNIVKYQTSNDKLTLYCNLTLEHITKGLVNLSNSK